MIKNRKYINNKEQLGMNLRRAREMSELTQNQVSNAISLNRSSITYYEIGKTLPTIFTLIKLAEVYNVDLLKLVTI